MIRVILLLIFLTGCSEDQAEMNKIYSFFRAGMIEAVLESGKEGNKYKGLVYEFGIGVKKDIDKAKYFYSKLNKTRSNERLFMLCFIHCPEEMEKYYKKTSNTSIAIYATSKAVAGYDCNEFAPDKVCNLVNSIQARGDNVDLYYEVGKVLYDEGIKQSINVRDFEVPYYLMTKSAEGGNINAKQYLDAIPHLKSWIPKILH